MFRLIFLFFLFNLSAQEELKPKLLNIHEEIKEPALVDLKGVPSSTVRGCVNAITGNYFESNTDLFVTGANPYPLSRIYNSASGSDGSLCYGWSINFLKKIRYESKIVSDEEFVTVTLSENGSKILYGPERFCYSLNLKLPDKAIKHGITNCSDGVLSARHNMKNSTIYVCEKEKVCIQTTEDQERTEYKDIFGRYWAKYTTLANGCRLEYRYGKDNLVKLHVKGRPNGAQLGTFEVNIPADFKKESTATISLKDAPLKVNYTFEKGYDWQLSQVESNFAPTVKYEYSKKGKLTKKEYPDGRYRMIRYVDGKDYVQDIFEPVGHDDTPISVLRFQYGDAHEKDYKRIKYVTKVTNALGHKTEYFSTKGGRLASIHHHGNVNCYRKENFYWGDKDTYESSFLIARELKDYDNKTVLCRCYEYDLIGNATKEIFAGNLIGTSTTPPVLEDGVLQENGCPQYVKNYTYHASNLVKSESDGTQSIDYEYYPDTNLVKFKYIKDETGLIRERYYFEYDNNSALIKQIYDDGSRLDINNLEKVTERHTILHKQTTSYPIGLPEIDEEYVYDLENRCEVLIKMVVNKYNHLGQKIREEVYDDQRNFRYAKEWQYDNYGNLLCEIDPQGLATLRSYDANGNCVFQQTSDASFYTVFSYDYSNRLIKEEDIHTDGTRLSQCYNYDFNSNCIAATDIYGNTTKFKYDEFDRCVLKLYPETENNDGGLYNPHEKIAYDVANNPIIKTDANGHTLFIVYTAWGKPHYVQYADSATETSEYSVDGKLIRVTDPKGAITKFEYDYKKRKTKQETYDPNGKLLTTQTWKYNAFHLLSETDPNGNTINYEYVLGRLSQVKKVDKVTKFAYDALGRKTETIDVINDTQFRKTVVVYDNMDRIIEERIEDTNGEWIEKKSLGYDVAGRKNNETVYLGTTAITTQTIYDPYGKPLKIQYPDGTITHFHYRYDYINEHGQGVGFQEEIDAKGNVQRRIMDTVGNLSQEIYLDPFGQILKETKFNYDGEGNLTKRVDNVISEGKSIREVITRFEYDCRGNQIKIVEAYGQPEQKTTQKEYNFFGDVTKIIKADAIILFHTYDYLGRLINLRSSDDTVHYGYNYDLNHNVIGLIDYNHDTVISRTFDCYDNLLEEKFETIKMQYEYDLLSRMKKIILPDETNIDYIYDEQHLCEIRRKDYAHKYEYYDYSNRIKKLHLPFDLGTLEYTYDLCLRPISIKSNYDSIENTYDEVGNLVSSKDAAYTYDALHQLASENGFFKNTFCFDSLYNRTKKNDVAYENNALNQLINEGENNYTYDKNGNFTLSGTRKCYYDALDRLVSIEDENIRCDYIYDAFHRRLNKKVFRKDQTQWKLAYEEPYIYQGTKEIGIFKNGNVEQLRILGVGSSDIGAAVAIQIENKTYVPLHNARGDITTLLNAETKQVCETYKYSAFGEESCSNPNSLNPWRFSSKRVDSETSWIFFGRRYYDPRIGRWTTPDPLLFEDGPNLYAYVKNRPLIFVDPYGLDGRIAHTYIHYDNFCNALAKISVGLMSEIENSKVFTVCGPSLNHILISTVNGINNDLDLSQRNDVYLSTLAGGCMIRGIYNASAGIIFDLFECLLNYCFVNTEAVKLLHQQWDMHFEQYGDEARIIHVCHSQGAIITRNALRTYDPKKRKKIGVIAVSPALYIDSDLCDKVIHLVSDSDFIPWIDFFGRMRNKDTIKVLKKHPNASRFDHDFQSPTFTLEFKSTITDFIFNYGGVF